MHSSLTPDQAVVHVAVGVETFLRGREYWDQERVGGLTWNADRRVAYARVEGSGRRVYVTTVTWVRDGGALRSVSGSCTCPMAKNCKHVAAVALQTLDELDTVDDAVEPTPQAASSTPAWQAALDALTPRVAAPHTPTVGLQFDVARTAGRPTGIKLRPVLPVHGGRWSRSGVNWHYLHGVTTRGTGDERVALLREFANLTSAPTGGRFYYTPSRDAPVVLQTVSSRRVWDLLDELRAVGVPFVESGRAGGAVEVLPDAARLTFDLRGADSGDVEIAPRLAIDDDVVPHEKGLFLGQPTHGVAWDDERGLVLARLAPTPGVDVARVLGTSVPRVPAAAREQLITHYLPRLAAVAPLRSSDASVVIPEPEPPRLTLRLEHREGHRLAVEWRWTYAVGNAVRTEPLWNDLPGAGRDADAERRILRRVDDLTVATAGLRRDGRLLASVALQGMAVVEFLRDVVPAVEQDDDVDVTVLGEPVEYREVVDPPTIEFQGSTPDRDWFDLRVHVAVGGEAVVFESLFAALARRDDFLILPSGTYFSLTRPEFAQLLALIGEAQAMFDAPPGTVRVARLQLGVWDELDKLGIVTAQADQWRAAARALATVEQVEAHPVPSGLVAELRPYQADGFSWLANLFELGLGGVLADEMGLGKTVQALALMCHVREKGLHDGPFLVVAPTTVVHNWAAEVERFAPGLVVRTVTETVTRRGVPVEQLAADADVVVTSYTLFRLEYDDYAAVSWAGLLLDEAQFVKNHQSIGYGCAKRLDVPFKLAITGTPLENNLMELWALLSIVAPGLFPHPRRFEQYYRVAVEREHDADRLAQLRTRVRPLLVRRTKSEVVRELPAKQEQVLEVELAAKHRRLYQTYLHRERQKVLGLLSDVEKHRFAIFRSLTLLRQASLDVGLVDAAHVKVPSAKLDVLLDHLVELAADGHKTVVFSQFTKFLAKARARTDAAGIAHCYLDGRTRRRAEVIERFRTTDIPVFFISLKAGGFGLTLTEADYCFLLDPWWNPATEAQAVDRLHRIGQRRSVMVYRLLARETIEQKVMDLKAEKSALFDAVLDAKGVGSGAMTAADIRGLLS